jgi:hypothetical protein
MFPKISKRFIPSNLLKLIQVHFASAIGLAFRREIEPIEAVQTEFTELFGIAMSARDQIARNGF